VKPNRTEYDSAFVANLAGEEAVPREKLVALLDGRQHTYSPSPRDAFLSERVGWSDPRFTLATEPCAKVGSLQPNSVPFRGHLDHSVVRNLFSFGHLLDREGEREVTDRVLCVFHAPVTFPLCKFANGH